MCLRLIETLPPDSFMEFLKLIGFQSAAYDLLDRIFPGGYNHSRRVRFALEAWSGFDLNPVQQQQQVLSLGAPRKLNIPMDFDQTESGSLYSIQKGDARQSEVILPSGRFLSSDPNHLDQYCINLSLLRRMLKVTDINVNPHRLGHVISLLGLEELHGQLNCLTQKAQQWHF